MVPDGYRWAMEPRTSPGLGQEAFGKLSVRADFGRFRRDVAAASVVHIGTAAVVLVSGDRGPAFLPRSIVRLIRSDRVPVVTLAGISLLQRPIVPATEVGRVPPCGYGTGRGVCGTEWPPKLCSAHPRWQQHLGDGGSIRTGASYPRSAPVVVDSCVELDPASHAYEECRPVAKCVGTWLRRIGGKKADGCATRIPTAHRLPLHRFSGGRVPPVHAGKCSVYPMDSHPPIPVTARSNRHTPQSRAISATGAQSRSGKH